MGSGDRLAPMPGKLLAAGSTALIALLLTAGSAVAAPVVNGEFPLPPGDTIGSDNEIVQGPDGNMWLTTETNSVVRVTPAGDTEAFPVPNTAFGITTGPDGNLWVSTVIGVTRISTASPAAGTAFNVGIANGRGIVTGPDGNIWVAGGDQLVRFDPADPEGTDDATTIPGMSAKGMDVGSDGLLWIADGTGRVISATATDPPTVTPYEAKLGEPVPTGGVQDVAAGPGGQIAYANPLSDPQSVGRLVPGGTPQVTELENTDPFGVVFGQDQAYWFARSQGNDLLRLTPDGAVTTLTGFQPSGGVGPRKIATGPGNTLWVTLDTPEKVARITGVEPPVTSLDTEITKGPKKKVETKKAKAKVKFKFRSDNANATFECKLKKKKKTGGGKNAKRAARFKPCESPKKYKLKPGKYRFQVRAVLGDNRDATPAKQKFKVVRKG